jgi:prefoldin subunit 5
MRREEQLDALEASVLRLTKERDEARKAIEDLTAWIRRDGEYITCTVPYPKYLNARAVVDGTI